MNFSNLTGPYGRYFRQMFYLVTPWETTCTSLESVPPFLDQSIPWFLLLMFLDVLYCWKKGMKDAYSLNDVIVSVGAGFIQTLLNKVALRTMEIYLYAWVNDQWAIYRLPSDSAWTWLLTFIVVDFFYYWMHRGAHEINIFWAFHQTHHSSEYYNLSTALRQGAFQQYVAILFYLPQALFIPPPMHMAHEILNRLYQFWIHTPVIGDLGPLEYLLNTPSHHRVHHGRNRYCIDKNYAGTLIVWDRIFGTFQPELQSKPVIYGLTHNINSFNAMKVQLCHLYHILFEKVPSVDGWSNKLRALLYGPGWSPGKPRLGLLEDIPEPTYHIKKYDSGVPAWISIYVFIHGTVATVTYMEFVKHMKDCSSLSAITFAISAIVSIYILGCLLEKRVWAAPVEIIRCLSLSIFVYPAVLFDNALLKIMHIIMAISAGIWLIFMLIRSGGIEVMSGQRKSAWKS